MFSHKTQQIFFLHHLVIGLALDIGLHRDYQPLNFPHRPKPTPPTPSERRERERAFLGCYYLSSMYAHSIVVQFSLTNLAGSVQDSRSLICSNTRLT